MSILTEAEALINGDRQEAYGHPAENFKDIATGWDVILKGEGPITPKQIALCMTWTKMCRETNKPQRDNIVDGVGYLGTVELIEDYNEEIKWNEDHKKLYN